MPEMRISKGIGLVIGILCIIGMMQKAGNTADPVATTPRDGSVSNTRPMLLVPVNPFRHCYLPRKGPKRYGGTAAMGRLFGSI